MTIQTVKHVLFENEAEYLGIQKEFINFVSDLIYL